MYRDMAVTPMQREYQNYLEGLFQHDMRITLGTDEGKRMMAKILLSLHYYDDIYVQSSLIYKHAALHDMAKYLVDHIKEINPMYMIDIDNIVKNQKKEYIEKGQSQGSLFDD